MPNARRVFPYLMVVLVLAALGWAVSFRRLPPADFTFINGTEVQSIDPAIVTGQPEGRIINGIFEGLYRSMPDPEDPTKLRPVPGAAESCEISEDGKTYTFTMREDARWSNGDAVTANDFVWSWRRFLHPETASQYAYQLHYVVGAKKYNFAELDVDDRVEVELADREDELQLFPRGTILSGILTDIEKPPKPELNEDATDEERADADAQWRKQWIYVVDVKHEAKSADDGSVDWDANGETRRFCKDDTNKAVETCMHLLSHFSEVGISASDTSELVVQLNDPDSIFSRFGGVLSSVSGQSQVCRRVRCAELDQAGKDRYQRAVHYGVSPRSRPHSHAKGPAVLGGG